MFSPRTRPLVYMTPFMGALVLADGTLVQGKNVAQVTPYGPGEYAVRTTTAKPAGTLWYPFATRALGLPHGGIVTSVLADDELLVQTGDIAGAPANASFWLFAFVD